MAALWIVVALLPFRLAAQPAPTFEVKRIGVEQGLSHRLVYDILEDRQGYMWFATREGLNRFDGHRFVVYTHEPGDSLSIPGSQVNRLFESSDGTLWMGVPNGGLVRFDRSTETFRSVPSRPGATPQLATESVTDIAETPDGTLWVNTMSSRIFRLDPNASELEYVPVTDGQRDVVSSNKFGIDPSGRIVLTCSVIGTNGFSLGWLDPVTNVCSMGDDFSETSNLGGIDFEPDGSAVFAAMSQIATGTNQIRVVRWGDQMKWSVTVDASIPQDVLVDDREQIWLATSTRVFLIAPTGRVLSHFTHSQSDSKTLSDDRANGVARSRDGAIWIATEDGVTVFIPTHTPFRAIRSRPGDPTSLGDPRVNSILETSDGALWVGTSKGLYVRSGTQEGFESIDLPDLPGVASGTQARIWSMIEAAPGVIWYGTAWGGLHRVDTATRSVRHLQSISQQTARMSGVAPPEIDRLSVPFIGRDRVGNLWLTTLRAVFRADSLEAVTLVASGSEASVPVDRFANVLMQDGRGEYWAGNTLGLKAFDVDAGTFRVVGENGIRDRGLSFRSVWTMAESPLTPNALWVGTIGGGLNRYDVKTGLFTWYTTVEGLPHNTIFGILVDDRGLLWLSTTNGLARFDPRSGSVERFSRHDGLHDNEFDLLAYHKGKVSGKMWFGGPTGLTEFHPDSVSTGKSDFQVMISGISVLDRPNPGIVGDGDTLRLSHTENSLGFQFSAANRLHPNDVAYRYRLEGYDDGWRMNDARRPEASYTRLPPGWYTFELQAAGPGGIIRGKPTRLVISIVPAFWQTGWFRFLFLILALGAFGWVVTSVQRRKGRRTMEIVGRDLELKRLLAEREEQERGRLAREIHDGPIQTLYSVNHRLEEASPDALEISRRDVQELASELRAICEQLRPALVANLGLEEALRARVRSLSDRHRGLQISFSFDPECSVLDAATGHACYRIVQESLANIVHHANATHADIQISRDDALCRLHVSDNGRGFELPQDWLQLAQGGHYGLVGIRERAEIQGGICRIVTAPGEGTRIEVDFPIASSQPGP